MATLGTFTAGQVLTAAELNAIGTWTSYTPTVKFGTNTVSGTIVGIYTVVNELLIYNVKITSPSWSGSGNLNVTLPVTCSTTNMSRCGYGNFWNGSASQGHDVTPYMQSSTVVQFIGGAGTGIVNTTSLFTINGSTEMYFTVIVEVA